MPHFARALGASKAASALLVLFIPGKDRRDQAIDQEHWVNEALQVLGVLFGGAHRLSARSRRMARRCSRR
jgi:hypothetical protein